MIRRGRQPRSFGLRSGALLALTFSVAPTAGAAEAASTQPTSVPATHAAGADAGFALVRRRASLAQWDRELERYRIDGDIRTHLFFRYADDPGMRATIACLLQTERLLRDFCGMPPRPGPPAVPGGTSAPARDTARLDAREADELFRWGEDALRRVRSGARPAGFRPDRELPSPSQLVVGWAIQDSSPGVFDAATDLDLAACLGAKVFVDARAGVPEPQSQSLAGRARFLGVAYMPLTAADSTTRLPTTGYETDAVGAWRCALWLRALSRERSLIFSLDDAARRRPWLVEATAACGIDFLRLADVLQRFPAPADVAVFGEARRARAVRDVLADVQVPAEAIAPDVLAAVERMRQYRVLILADADHVASGLLDGIRRFREGGGILAAVGRCLSDVPRSGREGIPFDLMTPGDRLDPLCSYLSRLRDRGTILADQVLPVSPAGDPVPGLRSGSARDGQGRPVAYFVNPSPRPAALRLLRGGRPVAGRVRDLLCDTTLDLIASPVVLPPYAVWILRLP